MNIRDIIRRWLDRWKKLPVVIPPVAPPIIPPVIPPVTDLDLLFKINTERAVKNLPPYKSSPCLDQQAMNHCEWMVTHGMLHDGWQARVAACSKHPGQENIAEGYRDSRACVDAWMKSTKGHRENILGSWTVCGVGRSGNFWCAIFA